MEPRLEAIVEKKLVGKRLTMSFAENKTFELWKSFMPRRKEIKNNIGTNLYSIQIYEPMFFDNFNPTKKFEKWATMEVSDFDSIPPNMESVMIPEGLYAVFLYRGEVSKSAPFFRYILETWLPNSSYNLDSRPHFEILGEKYKNEDPDSKEEIWIPVKRKE